MIGDALASSFRFFSGAVVRDFNGSHDEPQVYYSNHTSHLDFLLIWSAFPRHLRVKVRPVAAKDYWLKGALRKYLAVNVFNAILVDRNNIKHSNTPLPAILEALKDSSIIIFPEGTRSDDGSTRKFKSGIFHIAKKCEGVRFTPVYVKNLNRILPKGEILFVPVLCSVTFGKSVILEKNENKEDFLLKTQNALKELETL